jgi:1,4-alpha-glucan branching enzyme
MMYGEGNPGLVPVNSESGFPPGFARNRIEDHLRNFTTIYEALGSSYISTEWLTGLEKKHTIFPQINYRIFRRKK